MPSAQATLKPGIPVETLEAVDIAVDAMPAYDPALPFIWDTGHEALLCAPVTGVEDPCPWCIRRRWMDSRPTRERESLLDGFARQPARHDSPKGTHPWVRRLTEQVFQWMAAENGGFRYCVPQRHVVVVGGSDLIPRTAQVMRWGRCPQPVHHGSTDRLAAQGDSTSRASGNRRASAADLELPVDQLIDRDTGVLGRTLPESWFHPVSVMAHGLMRERSIFKDRTLEFGMNGHGRSRRESRNLALLEGLERHSGLVQRNAQDVVRSTMERLPGRAMDPARFGVYPPEHFAPGRNQLGHVPWDPTLEVEWVRGRSATSGEDVWVPRQMVYYLARGDEPIFVQDNSNGCAVGSTLAECLLHGVSEVIERDAFLVHWLGASSMPRISTAEQRDFSGTTRTMLARLADAGFSTWLFDARADLPIPTIVAVVVRNEPGPGRYAVGASTDLDPSAAVRGALKEAGMNAPAMQRLYNSKRERAEWLAQDPERVFQMEDHGLLHAAPDAIDHLRFWLDVEPDRSLSEAFADWTDHRWASAADHGADPEGQRSGEPLQVLLEMLDQAQLEPVVVEQTSDECRRAGLRAAKTFVPGLLPLDFGAREMRAWSLPERAALRTRQDASLNTYPHPFT